MLLERLRHLCTFGLTTSMMLNKSAFARYLRGIIAISFARGDGMPRPITKLKRKVLHRGMANTTPKVSLPKWWIGDCEEVRIEVYADKLIIKKVEAGVEE